MGRYFFNSAKFVRPLKSFHNNSRNGYDPNFETGNSFNEFWESQDFEESLEQPVGVFGEVFEEVNHKSSSHPLHEEIKAVDVESRTTFIEQLLQTLELIRVAESSWDEQKYKCLVANVTGALQELNISSEIDEGVILARISILNQLKQLLVPPRCEDDEDFGLLPPSPTPSQCRDSESVSSHFAPLSALIKELKTAITESVEVDPIPLPFESAMGDPIPPPSEDVPGDGEEGGEIGQDVGVYASPLAPRRTSIGTSTSPLSVLSLFQPIEEDFIPPPSPPIRQRKEPRAMGVKNERTRNYSHVDAVRTTSSHSSPIGTASSTTARSVEKYNRALEGGLTCVVSNSDCIVDLLPSKVPVDKLQSPFDGRQDDMMTTMARLTEQMRNLDARIDDKLAAIREHRAH